MTFVSGIWISYWWAVHSLIDYFTSAPRSKTETSIKRFWLEKSVFSKMNIKDSLCMLRALQLISSRQCRAFSELASVQQLKVFEQACHDSSKNPRGLIVEKLKEARKYSRNIRIWARTNYTIEQKRALLKQRGGFLGASLPLLGTIVSAVIS